MRAMQLSNMPPATAAISGYPTEIAPYSKGNMPASERCVPEFEMQASTMDAQIEELHKFVEALEMKLKPVLKPQPLADAGNGPVRPQEPAVAPIADYLRDKNRSIRTALDKLSYLLHDRIDL